MCDKKVPLKLKGKFYRTTVRPTMLYGTKCWAVKSEHENQVSVAEMRMLRWMSGKSRRDRIKNRLRWLRHVEKTCRCRRKKRRSDGGESGQKR